MSRVVLGAAEDRGKVLPQTRIHESTHSTQHGETSARQAVTLKLGPLDGKVTGVGEPLCPWKLAVQMDSLLTKFSLKKQMKYSGQPYLFLGNRIST
jgi:hypothetical protein